MTFVYLTDQLVSEVHRALIDADLVDDTSIRALTSDIPPSFTRALPDGGTPAGRSLLLIRKLNSTRTLESGVKPLPRFLENAIMLSGGETERTAIFRKALAVTEIEIALTSDDVIDLAPGQEKPCEFEVHNRGARRRVVSFAVVRDAPGLAVAFDQDTLSLEPGGRESVRVVIGASDSAPRAGEHSLRITATERAATSEVQWRTGPRKVVVASVPQATLDPLDAGTAASGHVYRLSARLVNTGNQSITGTLRGAPGHSGPNLLDPGRVEPLTGIDLPLGGTCDVTVNVTLDDRPVTEQTWWVPLRFDVGDGGPSLQLGTFPLRQQGLATPVAAWLNRKTITTRLGLVIGGVLALVTGFVLRGILAPEDTTSASENVSATSVADADADPVRYGPMNCDPGRFVSLVATTNGDVDTGYVWHYLRDVARHRRLPPPEAGGLAFVDTIRASRWQSFCATTRERHSGSTADGPRRIIWLGPFGSADVAAAACRTLHDEAKWSDCLPMPL